MEATAPTTAVLAAGADEVSAVIAALFAAHGQAYQTLSAQAAQFHDQFVAAMTSAAGPTRAPKPPTSRRCNRCLTRPTGRRWRCWGAR
ncbi:PE family protein [Mycobacterium ulcerans str. Harvey]|uniref:PE family protein n=1 Tax=Mycobacterium ulcerans str. Harvey TaxID=1299332 RepID=A0ABP3ABL4_MYCUL|nr:PE family protein [Mycobacterium ulcerans str. Harvey]